MRLSFSGDLYDLIRLVQDCPVCRRLLHIRPAWQGNEICCPQCGATTIAAGRSVMPKGNMLDDRLLRRVDTILSSRESETTTWRRFCE